MTFSEAYYELSIGKPIKRSGWLGYWIREDENVIMHCKDGTVVSMENGCSPMFTLSHCCENDWTVVSDELKAELDKIHKSLILAEED